LPANENEISSTIRVRMGAGDFIEATGHVTKDHSRVDRSKL
jgi:hypothetical protein